MRRFQRVAVLALLASTLAAPQARAQGCGGPVSATTTTQDRDILATLDNGCVRRVWRNGTTTELRDLRTGYGASALDDFSLVIDGVRVTASSFEPSGARVVTGPGRAGIEWSFALLLNEAQTLTVQRRVEAYDGIAAFRATTTLTSTVPMALEEITLEQVAVGDEARTRLDAFRAGGDWREPEWRPQVAIGDPRTGDWRTSSAAGPGEINGGSAEWMSVEPRGGQRVALVLERRNAAASQMLYDGSVAAAIVDYGRDVVYLGPFEENAHVENGGEAPARVRAIGPTPVRLEPVVTVLGRDGDDEPWQFHRYLTEARAGDYHRGVVFNSDQVDRNERSTGAKDDMDFARFTQIIDEVREIGADTFVFDDGWQARSGDFCPDSPECPEPRWDGMPGTKFAPRFNDATFEQVRSILAGGPGAEDDIALGLWMNPMSFHPSADAFRKNPQWSCAPVGTATAVVNAAEPTGGSNEAGIGLWNPLATGLHPDTGAPTRMIDYMEDRIRRAIVQYGARYFKFDFLVWVDCAGVEPADMYAYHDAFVEMIDRVHADHPDVVMQTDDTNDYRMFPFETVSRGPSWFLNGGPSIKDHLHAMWTLAPEVPAYALGARALANGADRALGIDVNMAASLLEHLTISMPVDTALTQSERARVRRWTDFYKQYRHELATMTYPLLQDPRAGGWTALQPWNADTQTGWLLAFRQTAASAVASVAPRGLPTDGSFSVTRHDPASGAVEDLGIWTASDLRGGLPVSVPQPNGYALIRIAPAP